MRSRSRSRSRSRRFDWERLEGRALLSTFTVNTTADEVAVDPSAGTGLAADGKISLRSAVQAANATPGADSIVVPAGTYTLTIAGTDEDTAATGDLDITGDLTITGAGKDSAIIDGGGLDNVFQAIGALTANFSGLTIRGAGSDKGLFAGNDGIVADQATIKVTSCALTDNPGAGVLTHSGAITAADSTFATGPMGVDLGTESGSLTATNCTFSPVATNVAQVGSSTASVPVSVTGCTFNGGFGINTFGNVTANNCTFRDAIYGIQAGGNVTASNCTFIGSTDPSGGITSNGISATPFGVVVNVTGCTFRGRISSDINTGGSVTATNSGFSDFDTAILAEGDVSASGCTFYGDTSGRDPFGTEGINIVPAGGQAGNLTATNCTFSDLGAGISGAEEATLSFDTFSGDGVLWGIDARHLTIGNSILASFGENCSPDTVITSSGHNISSDNSCAAAFTQPGDRNNTDPKLGPLADNGGPTQTMALLPGSPALDAAGSSADNPATDQRGIARPQGLAPDIGAFELVQQTTTIGTQTSLSSSNPTSTAGQSITFTAVVSAQGSQTVPTGEVQFLEGSSVLDTETLDADGHATFTTSSLPVGSHAIVASYLGNDSFRASRSQAVTQAVNPASQAETTTQLTSDATSAPVGQAVTLTATVAGPSGLGIPTGTVTFLDGSTRLGTVGLDANGQAILTTSALGIGSHAITASYGGDSNFAPSTSTAATLDISGDGPVVTSVQRFGFHAQPTTLVLSFNMPLDPARAQDVANYRIVGPRRRAIAIGRAIYDAATRTVSLHPRQRLNLHYDYQLAVNGSTPSAVTGASGLALDGNNDGLPGGDFLTEINRHNLAGSQPDRAMEARARLGPHAHRTRHPLGPRSLSASRAHRSSAVGVSARR